MKSTPSFSLAGEVSAVVWLDNRVVDQTKWAQASNRSWEQSIKIDLHQVGPLYGQDSKFQTSPLELILPSFAEQNFRDFCRFVPACESFNP